ncbi:MAG: RluA family pseudouridine synthase [Planctomycetota bacterium]|nr:RluA family pseudouridine synthase [Planctomycetota bacterium]
MTDPLRIVLERDAFVVVDKPSGLLSVPGIGPGKDDCVASRVRAMFPRAGGPLIVHRLDMDTSGLIVVGLTEHAQRELSAQFERRTVVKSYVARLERCPEHPAGAIEVPIRLDVERRPYQVVDFEQGRPSLTRYRVLDAGTARVEFEPLTGRTHQIRVHAAFGGQTHWPARDPDRAAPRAMIQPPPAPRVGLGSPVLGDPLYGVPAPETSAHARPGLEPPARLCLHAAMLEFNDPDSGERVRVTSEASF